jgi:hypothetical protein
VSCEFIPPLLEFFFDRGQVLTTSIPHSPVPVRWIILGFNKLLDPPVEDREFE